MQGEPLKLMTTVWERCLASHSSISVRSLCHIKVKAFCITPPPKKLIPTLGKKKKEYDTLINFNFPSVEMKKFLLLVQDLFDAHLLIFFYQSFASLLHLLDKAILRGKVNLCPKALSWNAILFDFLHYVYYTNSVSISASLGLNLFSLTGIFFRLPSYSMLGSNAGSVSWIN